MLRASNGQFTSIRFAENQGVDYPAELLRIRVCSAEQVAQLRGRFRSVDVSPGNWNPLPAY
jgi:DUF971 family protein